MPRSKEAAAAEIRRALTAFIRKVSAGRSQAALAKTAQIDRTDLSRLLKGGPSAKRFSIDRLCRIATLLGASITIKITAASESGEDRRMLDR
jgi:transcriptional regulator with XRE-family HTH domain